MASSTLPGISIEEHGGPDTAAMIDRLTWIWVQENPGGPAEVRRELAGELTKRRGFRCVTASSDGNVIAYAYGMYEGQGVGLSEHGRTASIGSHDLITEWMHAEKSPGVPLVDPAWVDAYDVAEVQVLADHRRRGIADALIRRLCSRIPVDDRVVLTVDWRNVGAQSLYQQIGFRDLIGFPISSRIVPGPGQALMGLERAGDAVATLAIDGAQRGSHLPRLWERSGQGTQRI
jgi:ribosomal protein S18 acetylase RimI-like enzyme